MTSLHDSTKSKDIDHCSYEPKVDTKVISVCNEGSTIVVPLPSVSNQSFSPIPIVSVDVNTNCLCKSIVKIDFKSIINYQCFITVTGTPTLRLFVPLRITFQLTRTRNDGAKTLLKSWDYSYSSVALATNITSNFDFSYCDKNFNPGCYVYGVEIIRANSSLFGGTNTSTEIVSINSSSISVLAM